MSCFPIMVLGGLGEMALAGLVSGSAHKVVQLHPYAVEWLLAMAVLMIFLAVHQGLKRLRVVERVSS